MARHCEAMVGFLDAGAEVFDYGNSLRAEAQLGGFERAFDYPGFLPAYIRPLFCEGKGPFRWVALSGDPADIAATDQAVLDEFPDDEALARWIRARRRTGRLPGPAGAHLLARLRRAPPARPALQRDGAAWRAVGADRDRARPSRLGFGRVAVPGDRGDGRRLRRDRRLAVAQRPRQHRVRGVVGFDPPRRRCRDRAVDPRRHGVPRRRHRPRRRETRTGAHQRSRYGCDPPCRRRLRPRRRGRRGARRAHPDGDEAARDDRPADRHRRPSGAAQTGDGDRDPAELGSAAEVQAADRRPDRHDARRQRRRSRRPADRRVGADRGDRGRPQPALSVQAADPADGGRQPGDRTDRRRDGRDQRGLPVGAQPARQRVPPRATSASAGSIGTASPTTRSAADSPPGRSSTSATISTACCSSTGSPTRRRSRPGSSSSASTATPSSTASPSSSTGSGRDDDVLVRAGVARHGERRDRDRRRAGGRRRARDRRVATGRRTHARWRGPPRRADDARFRQRAQPRLPSGVAGTHPHAAAARSGRGATRCTTSPAD